MTAVFTILVLLIAVTPVLTVTGGIIAEGFLLAIAAVAIALIALTLQAVQFRRLAALLKPIIPVALVPGIWMLMQMVPAPGWLAHPAWLSASVALGKPLVGAVSLDIGATLLCLARYFLVLAIAIVATAVALDRQRAEVVLSLLTVAAASIAAALIGLDLGFLDFAGIELSAQRAQMLTITVIGLVLSCATVLRVYENHRVRRARNGKADTSPTFAMTASIAAFTICLSAVAINADAALLLAAACGVIVLIGLAVIRRSQLGPWGQSGIAAGAIVSLIGLFAVSPTNRGVDLTLSLSSHPQISIATADRMLSDAKWAGTGAGTFEALLPIYRDVDDTTSGAAPTAAALVAIEMGRSFLWGVVILALVGAWSLFKRALMRGREYVYAGAGVASIVAMLMASFASVGILGLAASLLTSVVFGLALAQSKSWST